MTSPREWAEQLAQYLRADQTRYPLQPLEAEQSQFRANWLAQKRWQPETEVISHPQQKWAVVYREDKKLEPSPLLRVIQVVAIDSLQDFDNILEGKRNILQTATVAAGSEPLFELANRLASKGVTRLTSIGKANHLHAGWNQDGYNVLSQLVKFVDLSPELVRASEEYNPYTD